MKTCIINVANGIYLRGQERLRESLKAQGFLGDVILWTDALPPGSPTQDESPMAFKPFAFKAAFEQGYELVLWLDASMMAVRRVQPIFARIARQGYYLWGTGAVCGEWAADEALLRQSVTREESLKIEEVVSCIVGLRNSSPKGKDFFSRWMAAASDGVSFRGIPPGRPWTDSRSNSEGLLSSDPRVKGHRWDQTAASLIAYELNMHISHLQCMDAIHYEHETWSYVHTLPLTIRMVQNRDIKNGECRIIAVNERLSGESGLLFACRRIVKTIKLLVKHLIIRGRFRRLHT
ncbi:MAG: hypothetical protein ABSG63_03280 [Spirochaetia bacterium]|jgi:hypothetical protein